MKNLNKGKIFFILGLFALLSSSFVVAADNNDYTNSPEVQQLNQQIADKKNKIEELKRASDEYAKKIAEYQDQSKSLKNQLAMLDNQMIKVQLDIQAAQMQIDQTNLEIDSLNYQINSKETEINTLKSNLLEYIKTLDKADRRSYLEILILNDSFAEFFNELNDLEQVQSDIKQSVDRLKILKESIEVERADKNREITNLEKNKSDLEVNQEKLNNQIQAKQTLVLETKSSESSFKRLLSQAQQEQSDVNTEISNLQNSLKQKIERIKKSGANAENTFTVWPVESHVITASFHDPDYPFRYLFEHPAVDIRAKQSTSIHAPADGYVARTVDAGYGYSYIILIHENNLSTVYGHVSAIYVHEGTYVSAGDVIGLSGGMPGTRGAGPFTLGPHLHFEVRLNGIPVNPLEYLP
ncbi:MAG: peptidoglycan DD-metalloendopeptidase family protein [Patescibacteria group bacterium]|nr:peptidoglycan DD-metalloendopeptidase family protein [Patescibacteria group bacterium]